MVGQSIPILYVEMDGTGVPVRKTEKEGRAGKVKGEPAHTREAKIGSVFTRQHGTATAIPFAIRTPRLMSPPSNRQASSDRESIWKPGIAAGSAPRRRLSSGMAQTGSGISPTITSPALFRSSTSCTPASTFGMWRANSIRARRPNRKAGGRFIRTNYSTKPKSKNS